jgi:hypothetical protein
MRRALFGIWAAVAALYVMGSLFGPSDEKAQRSTIQAEILKPSPPPLSKPQGEKPDKKSSPVVNNPTPRPSLSKHLLEDESQSTQQIDVGPPARSGSKIANSDPAETTELRIRSSELAEEETPSAEIALPLRKPGAASVIETVKVPEDASPEVETDQPLSRESASGQKKKASATSGEARKRLKSSEARSGKQKAATKLKGKEARKRDLKVASKAKGKKARKRDLRPYAYGSPRPYPRPYVYYRPYPRPYVYYRPYAIAPYALRRYHYY